MKKILITISLILTLITCSIIPVLAIENIDKNEDLVSNYTVSVEETETNIEDDSAALIFSSYYVEDINNKKYEFRDVTNVTYENGIKRTVVQTTCSQLPNT